MTNAIVLHGTGNNSQGNWFPWLKTVLEQLGVITWVPDLPNSEQPDPKLYNNFIFSQCPFDISNNTILIGHSSGAVAILRLLEVLPLANKLKLAVLVSAFKDNLGMPALELLCSEPFNFKKIRSQAERFLFLHSDNDPYCPLAHAEYLSDQVSGILQIVPGQGHFNLAVGPQYREFPLLLSLLKEQIDKT